MSVNIILQYRGKRLQELVSGAEKVRQGYDELMNWAKLFDNCNFEAKKMIIARADLGRPVTTPQQNKAAFMADLEG